MKKSQEPAAFVVAGKFDVIEHRRKRFHLVLANGETLAGAIHRESIDVDQMRAFWGKKVTIKGIVHFRPSGKPRLIEAQVIKSQEPGEEIFEMLPLQGTESEPQKVVLPRLARRGWLEDVWGLWPGDESIEDLLAALKKT